MRVIDWIKYTNDLEDDDRTWSDEAYDAIVDNIVENRYCFDAQYHQYGTNGVPVIEFDDGTTSTSTFTQRAWGALMASAWNKIIGQDKYDYVDFYYGIPQEMTEKCP